MNKYTPIATDGSYFVFCNKEEKDTFIKDMKSEGKKVKDHEEENIKWMEEYGKKRYVYTCTVECN